MSSRQNNGPRQRAPSVAKSGFATKGTIRFKLNKWNVKKKKGQR
jgi:hypothetical protein